MRYFSLHVFLSLRKAFSYILRDLAEAGKLPLPESGLPPFKKRARGSDVPVEFSSSSSSIEVPVDVSLPRPTAGSRRVSDAPISSRSAETTPPRVFSQTFDTLGSLPVHSSELGQLPLHHGVKYPINFNFQDMSADIWNARQEASSSSLSTLPTQISPTLGSVMGSNHDDQYAWNNSFDYSGGSMGDFGNSASGSFPQSMSEYGDQNSFGPQLHVSQQMQHQQVPGQMAPQYAQPLSNGISPVVQPELLDMLFGQPQPANKSGQMGNEQNVEAYMHKDTLQMWSNAPTGFEYVFILLWTFTCAYHGLLSQVGRVVRLY